MSTLQAVRPRRALVEPTWWACPEYEYTLGPEVAEIASLAGFAPDPEQQLLLDGTFGVAANGKAAAFEVDVIAARRALKTGFIVQALLGWGIVTKERRVVYTAHDLRAAQETFETTAGLIENTPALSKLLLPSRGDRPGIVEGNGRWAIRFKDDRWSDGRRIAFMTRGKRTGRALSGDKLVIDEGFAATPLQLGSVLPIMAAEADPQYVLASSAGMIGSLPLISARDLGRNGGTARQLYAEWGDRQAGLGCAAGERCDHTYGTRGCVLDNEDRWAAIIPELDGRVQRETIRSLRSSMPALEFAREFMVWWDVDGGDGIPPAIDFTVWRRRERRDAPRPEQAAIFVDVAPLGDWSTIAAAGAGSDGRTLVITLTAPGTGWLVAKLKELRERTDVAALALWPQSKAGGLIPTLVKNEIEHETVSSAWMGQACTLLQEKVKNDEMEHVGQNDLDSGVKNATTRWSGEAELWNRRDPTVNISPVVAASGAVALWERLVDEDYDIEDSYLSDDDSDEDVDE